MYNYQTAILTPLNHQSSIFVIHYVVIFLLKPSPFIAIIFPLRSFMARGLYQGLTIFIFHY